MKILDTYTIEKISTSDAESIHYFLMTNSQRFARYFPLTIEKNKTLELAKEFVLTKAAEFQKREEFLFTIKHNRLVVGMIYIKELNWDKKQGEFAYCIDMNHKGKGVISKAVQELTQYAFIDLGLEILQISVHKDNLPSLSVAKNCHFNWVKTLSKAYTPPNEDALDMELYERYLTKK